MVIFHSYVSLPEGNHQRCGRFWADTFFLFFFAVCWCHQGKRWKRRWFHKQQAGFIIHGEAMNTWISPLDSSDEHAFFELGTDWDELPQHRAHVFRSINIFDWDDELFKGLLDDTRVNYNELATTSLAGQAQYMMVNMITLANESSLDSGG